MLKVGIDSGASMSARCLQRMPEVAEVTTHLNSAAPASRLSLERRRSIATNRSSLPLHTITEGTVDSWQTWLKSDVD